MGKRQRKKRLWDSYRFGDFHPSSSVAGVFGDRKARVIRLSRRSKKLFAEHAGRLIEHGTTAGDDAFAIFPVVERASTLSLNTVA